MQKLRREIGDREEEVNRLKAKWESEKEALAGVQPLKEEIENLRSAYDQAFKQAQRTNSNADYITAHEAEQKLRAAEKRLEEAEQRVTEAGDQGD
jgi:ATP-dependent Clp protease ATP-binding subunit ClpB